MPMVMLVGDFNARVQVAQPGGDGLVGRQTFCMEVDTLHLQTEEGMATAADSLNFWPTIPW